MKIQSDKEWYKTLDNAVKKINLYNIRQFSKLKVIENFDTINKLNSVDKTFTITDEYSKKIYRQLYKIYYKQLSDKAIKDDIVDAYLLGLLNNVGETTGYIYENEIIRKQDRLKEALQVSNTPIKTINTALTYWTLQQTQTALDSIDGATRQAYKDNKVKYVMWHTQEDGRVCEDCSELEGKVYKLAEAPYKQHMRCRCRLIAVKDIKGTLA